MIRFQADADLDRDVVVGVKHREPALDFASAPERLVKLPDPQVLELAVSEGRILVTHDRRTIPLHFRKRLDEGKSSPGVFLVSQFESVGPVVEAILMVWSASQEMEWRNQIFHLPSLTHHDLRIDERRYIQNNAYLERRVEPRKVR